MPVIEYPPTGSPFSFELPHDFTGAWLPSTLLKQYLHRLADSASLSRVPGEKLPEEYSLLTLLQNTNNISCAFMFLFTTFGFVFLLQPVTGCDTK